MNKLICRAVATVSLTMMSTAAFAQCMIYPKPNYQGGEGIIQPNDFVFFAKELENTKGEDGYRVYFDSQWLNNLNSSRTTNSCTLVRMSHYRDKSGFEKAKGNVPNFATKEVVGAFCHCP